MTEFTWGRRPELDRPGYEVSTQGDTRFSALTAMIRYPGLRQITIEQKYQLDVKGYRRVTNNWRIGKGRPPILKKDHAQLWEEYLGLWRLWAEQNPGKIELLRKLAAERGHHLLDTFATTPINQAHALAVILNETRQQEIHHAS